MDETSDPRRTWRSRRRGWWRLAAVELAVSSALVVLVLTSAGGSDRRLCLVPAVSFVTPPGSADPDQRPRQWIEDYWREPARLVAVEETVDERGRPTRIATWEGPTGRLRSAMSQQPDGSWVGGLDDDVC